MCLRCRCPSFYQVNRDQAEQLYALAVEFANLKGGETALELYCGAGTITLALAEVAGRVIGAEIVPEAIENAKANAVHNGISNVEFFCGDAGEMAQTCARRGAAADVVVVDPPRKGLAPEVIDAVAAMDPAPGGVYILRSGHTGAGCKAFCCIWLSSAPRCGGGYVSANAPCGDGGLAFQGRDRLEKGSG